MWSWHCNSTLQEYRSCYRPWTILLLFQMASKDQMHLYCCLGFYLELSLFGWLFLKDEPRNKRLVDPVTWQLQYVVLWFQLFWGKCFLVRLFFLYLMMKIITWVFKRLVLLCLNVYFNEMKLEPLRSLRNKTVARLSEVSVTVNNEQSADGCLAPLLADSFVVKTISCLVGEGEKERTGSEVGKADV